MLFTYSAFLCILELKANRISKCTLYSCINVNGFIVLDSVYNTDRQTDRLFDRQTDMDLAGCQDVAMWLLGYLGWFLGGCNVVVRALLCIC